MKNDIFSGTEKEKQSLVYIRRAGNEQIKKPTDAQFSSVLIFVLYFQNRKKREEHGLKWEMTPHWRLCRGCPWTQGWTWKWVLDHQVMFIHEPVGFMSHKVGDALDRAPQASRFMFASSSSSPCVCAVYSSLFFSSLGSAQVFSRWYFY